MTRGLSDPLSDGAELPALGGRVALTAWASNWPGLPAGRVARLLGRLGVTITPGWGYPGAGTDDARFAADLRRAGLRRAGQPEGRHG
jgi:hypothetical protein